MSKRVVAILLSILMVLSIVPFVNAEEASNNKIDWLVENNYVKGRDGGKLELEKNITRAEFAKMVLVVTGELGVAEGFDTTSRFSDVPSTHWACAIINFAKQKGYINGYVDGTFHPDEFITYEEAITILSRLNKDFVKGAADNGYWAQPYIDYALRTGILDGIAINNYKDLIVRRYAFEMVYNEIMLYQRLNQPVEDTSKKEAKKTPESRPTPRHKYFDNEYRRGGSNDYYPPIPPTPPTPPTPDPGPTCPTEAELQKAFAKAVGAAVNGITIPDTIATKEYKADEKKATVIIKDAALEKSVTEITGSGAMVALEKLVKKHGLVSYQIKDQALRTLEGATKQQMKEWIVEDFGNALGLGTQTLKLGDLVGKIVEAEVAFKSTDANCKLTSKDTYKVEFVKENCPTEAKLQEDFAQAVETALGQITVNQDIATYKFDKETKSAVVTIADRNKSVTEITGTGAMVALEKLVKEKGLVSYQIKGQELRTLEGTTTANIKEWIVDDFGAALNITDLRLGNLVGKNLEAEVVFKSTDANCKLTSKDTYKITFEAKDCPTEAKLKEDFAQAVETALGQITVNQDIATYKFDKETKSAVVTIADRNKSVTEIAGTGAMVALEKLVKEKGLVSYQIKGQELRTLEDAKTADIKEWIVNDFGAALNITDLRLGNLAEKTVEAEVKFKSMDAGCERIISDNYSVKFEAKDCPAEAELQKAFAEAVGAALKKINLSENLASFEYDSAAKSAVVTIKEGAQSFAALEGTNAVAQLKDLVDNHGLVSYQILGQVDGKDFAVRELTGKKAATIKEWIVEDFGAGLNVENFKLGNLIGKTLSAKVVFKSTEAGCEGQFEDIYKVEFKGANCPAEAELQKAFAEAVGAALKKINLSEDLAKYEYDSDKKSAVVTIKDKSKSFAALEGTNAMEQLKKLVDEKGLVSYQVEGQAKRVLRDAKIADIKEWIVEDFGAALKIQNFTLGDLIDKELSAKVIFESDCNKLVEDTYTVSFKGTEETPAPEERPSATYKVTEALGIIRVKIMLKGFTKDQIESISIGGTVYSKEIIVDKNNASIIHLTIDDMTTEEIKNIVINIKEIGPINVGLEK